MTNGTNGTDGTDGSTGMTGPKDVIVRGAGPMTRATGSGGPAMKAMLIVVLTACAPSDADRSATAPPDPHVLISADSSFDADVAERGSAAWVEWFADDGAMVQPGVGEVRGRARIGELVAYLDDPETSLRWTPVRADIAASGDLGWTTGTYVVEGPGPDGGTARGTGVYVSIWRLQADGSWKVVMDLGNPAAAGDPAG